MLEGITAKIVAYCNYQERSHKEVIAKLYELGMSGDNAQQILTNMIELNLVNEERYAKAVARGKFHVKHWGKNKIIHRLKQQNISQYCIGLALKEINPNDYYETVRKQACKKWEELLKKDKRIYINKKKLYSYLFQKGYEASIINEVLGEILKNEPDDIPNN